MIRIRKNRDRLTASGKLMIAYYCANARHYFHLYLWPDRAEMVASGLPQDGILDMDTKACVCLTPVMVRVDDPDVRMPRRKLGEMHFVVGDWDLEVVAHECAHVLAEVLRSVSPSAEDVVGQVGQAEEQMAYRLGAWVHNVYQWLWEHDTPDGWELEDA